MLRQISLGRPRNEALQALQDRLHDDDITKWCSQSTRAKSSARRSSAILRDQAEQMRLKRSQRGEKAAAEAQVNIVFPGMVVMIACLLVVIAPICCRQCSRCFREKEPVHVCQHSRRIRDLRRHEILDRPAVLTHRQRPAMRNLPAVGRARAARVDARIPRRQLSGYNRSSSPVKSVDSSSSRGRTPCGARTRRFGCLVTSANESRWTATAARPQPEASRGRRRLRARLPSLPTGTAAARRRRRGQLKSRRVR